MTIKTLNNLLSIKIQENLNFNRLALDLGTAWHKDPRKPEF